MNYTLMLYQGRQVKHIEYYYLYEILFNSLGETPFQDLPPLLDRIPVQFHPGNLS